MTAGADAAINEDTFCELDLEDLIGMKPVSGPARKASRPQTVPAEVQATLGQVDAHGAWTVEAGRADDPEIDSVGSQVAAPALTVDYSVAYLYDVQVISGVIEESEYAADLGP